MLKHGGVDAVVLATPHSLHAPQVIAAAAAGKHVYLREAVRADHARGGRRDDAVRKAGVTLASATTAASIPR